MDIMSEVISRLLTDPGAQYGPPELVLGQFERVGSTFYLDQLEKTHVVHNEPYKLLLPEQWPIARSYDGPLQNIDDFFADPTITATDKHWFRNFVAALHSPEGQVVKETNLFLALPQFLDIFPDSPVQLLTRDPRGIISSFKRNGLFERWNYSGVAELLARQIEAGNGDQKVALLHMVERDGPWQERLAWMIGFNAVLLSTSLEPEREMHIVEYERDIVLLGQQQEQVHERVQDSIFATNITKTHDNYEDRFDASELAVVDHAIEACSEFVQQEFSVREDIFKILFSRHVIASGHKRKSSTIALPLTGSVSAATDDTGLEPLELPSIPNEQTSEFIRLGPEQGVRWASSLVTNQEMATFLKSLYAAGMDPRLNNLLLLDCMPPARGGRILFDHESGELLVATGFEDHPTYWVSWLTSALYAYSEGASLPSYDEWEEAFQTIGGQEMQATANHSYANDDVTPSRLLESGVPDDFFGNLKIWCSDWASDSAVSKNIAGISWKNYLHEKYKTKAERPYLTSSRIIGLRLVSCAECPIPQRKPIEAVKRKVDQIAQLVDVTPVETADDLRRLNVDIANLVSVSCSHRHPGVGDA